MSRALESFNDVANAERFAERFVDNREHVQLAALQPGRRVRGGEFYTLAALARARAHGIVPPCGRGGAC